MVLVRIWPKNFFFGFSYPNRLNLVTLLSKVLKFSYIIKNLCLGLYS